VTASSLLLVSANIAWYTRPHCWPVASIVGSSNTQFGAVKTSWLETDVVIWYLLSGRFDACQWWGVIVDQSDGGPWARSLKKISDSGPLQLRTTKGRVAYKSHTA